MKITNDRTQTPYYGNCRKCGSCFEYEFDEIETENDIKIDTGNPEADKVVNQVIGSINFQSVLGASLKHFVTCPVCGDKCMHNTYNISRSATLPSYNPWNVQQCNTTTAICSMPSDEACE